MNLKKANDFFGISLSLIGLLKVLLIVLIFVQSGNIAAAMVTGGNANTIDFSIFSRGLGIAQIILAICSIIMIFINLKSSPDVVTGYLIGLGALALEIILPSIIYFVYVFVECGLYIKAGNKIRNKTLSFFNISTSKSNEEMVENTDWFYKDK